MRMLAVAMNDAALPVAHGFPARLVIPGLYGYVSACKWITDIEVTTYAVNSVLLGSARLGSRRPRSRPSPGSTCRPGTTR